MALKRSMAAMRRAGEKDHKRSVQAERCDQPTDQERPIMVGGLTRLLAALIEYRHGRGDVQIGTQVRGKELRCRLSVQQGRGNWHW